MAADRRDLFRPSFEIGAPNEYKGRYRQGDPRYRKENNVNKRAAKRDMIAWDGEGINLRGKGLPQNYVLFGCSADVDNPLIIDGPTESLSFEAIAEYILDIDRRFPKRWHVGYFFGYDQNMIIQSLHWGRKERLYELHSANVGGKNGNPRYNVKYIPGKTLTITLLNARGDCVQSVTIEDMGSFFATSFIKAYRNLFPEREGTTDYRTILEGKARRAATAYEDLPEVTRYWKAEIVAMRDLSERFRDLMWGEGFYLRNWYGPGAFANYLRRTENLKQHEWGGKEENIPPEVHHAAKSSMFGGRFEQFQMGRFLQTVYGIDRNSAYPDAFCNVPSLRQGGEWVHVTEPSSDNAFGMFHIRFRADEARPIDIPSPNFGPDMLQYPVTFRAMPFPFRTKNDTITYPTAVDGWYHTPEVTVAKRLFGDRVQIIEGWEWIAAEENEYPWRDLMLKLFSKRQALRKPGHENPAQMGYKLGMNCLYGKAAQRVGFSKLTMKPPQAHTLVVAGYITSYVRARMFEIMAQIDIDSLIAVETDGIYTTTDPKTLDIPSGLGKALGQWGVDVYDECMYIQNGFYIMRKGDEWQSPKTRGFRQDLVTPESLAKYLNDLTPNEMWKPLELSAGQRFISLGSALMRARGSRANQVNPLKAHRLHCVWQEEERIINPNGKGKRKHCRAACPECAAGWSPYDAPHPMYISEPVMPTEYEVKGYPLSKTFVLPWEKDYVEPAWLESDEMLGLLNERELV